MASNPILKESVFNQAGQSDTYDGSLGRVDPNFGVMSVAGTVDKTLILTALLFAMGVIGYTFCVPALTIVCALAGFGIVILSSMKPSISPITAPLYALISGYAVGGCSLMLTSGNGQSKYSAVQHAIPTAVAGTVITLGVMLALYRFKIIRVTDQLRGVIIGATVAIGLTYLVTFIARFIFPEAINNLAIYNSGPIGIGFSIFVISLAAFNFLLNFDFIDRGSALHAPKYMEWFAALGMLVTIVWMYTEILRLLRKMR